MSANCTTLFYASCLCRFSIAIVRSSVRYINGLSLSTQLAEKSTACSRRHGVKSIIRQLEWSTPRWGHSRRSLRYHCWHLPRPGESLLSPAPDSRSPLAFQLFRLLLAIMKEHFARVSHNLVGEYVNVVHVGSNTGSKVLFVHATS